MRSRRSPCLMRESGSSRASTSGDSSRMSLLKEAAHLIDNVIDLRVAQLFVDRKAEDLLHQPLRDRNWTSSKVTVAGLVGHKNRMADFHLDAACLKELPECRPVRRHDR